MIRTIQDSGTQAAGDLFPSKAQELISGNNGNADLTVIDVSMPQEFVQRHLDNAINISFFSRRFKSQINLLDRNKTYLVYCKVGGRSKLAQRTMRKSGFDKVYNLKGGAMLWEEEGLTFAEESQNRGRTYCPVYFSMAAFKKIKSLMKRSRLPLPDSTACSKSCLDKADAKSIRPWLNCS